MAKTGKQNKPSTILHSPDHNELLDAIDHLRSQGASNYVDLPQIVVCGDQSSGKSSVLEAISGVSFPRNDNLCTRFATELVLRRGPQETIAVSIQPGEDRTEDEVNVLSAFTAPNAQLSDLPNLVESAKTKMGIGENGKTFSKDVLKMELTGPKQPHLTLVDLPGLIRTETKSQTSGDVQLVENLVKSYMENPRSIILAVVSAKNDYANQVVTKLARDVDPKGLRTMGIITKPDTPEEGSPSEKFFVNVVRNEETTLRLGWHALRNRTYNEREWTDEQRDIKEKEFFETGIWTSLHRGCLGIFTLKPRLTQVLRDQIRAQMPSLIEEVKTGIADCESRLAKLGMERTQFSDQQKYLAHISRDFGLIVKAAVEGTYTDDFFGDLVNQVGFSKRLRAVVQDHFLKFADDMRDKGHTREIVSDDYRFMEEGKQISRSNYLEEVKELMRKRRGCELPGTFNPLIVGDLFLAQAQPWKQLVNQYSEKILHSTAKFLNLALEHTTPDEHTRLKIQQMVIGPAIDVYEKELAEKIEEILRPYQSGHPITYNHYFTETIQKMKLERDKRAMSKSIQNVFGVNPGNNEKQELYLAPATLLDGLTNSTEKDMDTFACSEAIDCMEAYYKVAIKVLVDNFAILAVEYCLLKKLPDLFTPEQVLDLCEDTVHSIAAETDDSKIERNRANKKLNSLRESLIVLQSHTRYGTSSDSVNQSLGRAPETPHPKIVEPFNELSQPIEAPLLAYEESFDEQDVDIGDASALQTSPIEFSEPESAEFQMEEIAAQEDEIPLRASNKNMKKPKKKSMP